jgi:precorrin-6Y C5,15-methyltransferase (decarboxylating)
MAVADPIGRESAAPRRWLSIVGIGEDGVDGLTVIARGLVSAAEIVFGGKRHLALAGPLIRGAARPWPSPFDRAVEEVVAQRGRQVCVLASGDPYL